MLPEMIHARSTAPALQLLKCDFKDDMAFLHEVSLRLDALDEASSNEDVGPLSLMLCNLESFCLSVEVDRRLKSLSRSRNLRLVK